MSNKKAGNDFEAELCRMLAAAGYWAHNMANRKNGQPADVIAVKDGRAWLIDCKDCARDVFDKSRIEDNQRAAMQLWEQTGNGFGWFALKTSRGVYMITLDALERYPGKSLKEDDLWYWGQTWDEWII